MRSEPADLPDVQFGIFNPDYRPWLGQFEREANEIITNSLRSLIKTIEENRPAIIRGRASRKLPSGWHVRCRATTGWLAGSFPSYPDDDRMVQNFLMWARHPASYARLEAVILSLEQCWLEFAAVNELPSGAMSAGITVHRTVREALDSITRNPGRGGNKIAAEIKVTPEHFRSHIVPQLKKLGVVNENGYRLSPKAAQRTIASNNAL